MGRTGRSADGGAGPRGPRLRCRLELEVPWVWGGGTDEGGNPRNEVCTGLDGKGGWVGGWSRSPPPPEGGGWSPPHPLNVFSTLPSNPEGVWKGGRGRYERRRHQFRGSEGFRL